MNEKNSAVNQTTVGTSEAFARILNRITDRLLPDTSKENASRLIRYFPTALGTFTWALFGILVGIPAEADRQRFGAIAGKLQDESNSLSISPDLASVLSSTSFEWTDRIIDFPIPIALVLVFLIGRSFKRGQPLTFFFWGLIFPMLTLRILWFSFYGLS